MDGGGDRARPAGDSAAVLVVRPRAWWGRSQWYVAMGVLWVGLGVTGIVFVPGQWDNWFRVLFGLVWFFFAVSLRRWERVELGPDELRLVRPGHSLHLVVCYHGREGELGIERVSDRARAWGPQAQAGRLRSGARG